MLKIDLGLVPVQVIMLDVLFYIHVKFPIGIGYGVRRDVRK